MQNKHRANLRLATLTFDAFLNASTILLTRQWLGMRPSH